MAVVYMRSSNGEFLALDVTEEVTKRRGASITSSSIQSGADVADGYTVQNSSISFTGMCTGSKIRDSEGDDFFLTPYELDLTINEMIESQERFILYGNDLIPTLENVVITSYSVIQRDYQDTLKVSLTVEQVFVSEAAGLSSFTETLTPSSKVNGAYEQEKQGGDGKKKDVDVISSFSEDVLGYYGELITGAGETLGIGGGE